MKKYLKWIVLLLVAIPVIGIVGVPMVMPNHNTHAVTLNNEEKITKDGIDPIDNKEVKTVSVLAPSLPEPVFMDVTPPIEMKMVLNDIAKTIIAKTSQLKEKKLDVAIEKALAKEREAKMQHLNKEADEFRGAGIGIGKESYLEYKESRDLSPLSRVVLYSLITSGGKTSAYLSIDGIAPVRVIKGSVLSGVKVISIKEDSVTIGFEKETRYLAGGIYD